MSTKLTLDGKPSLSNLCGHSERRRSFLWTSRSCILLYSTQSARWHLYIDIFDHFALDQSGELQGVFTYCMLMFYWYSQTKSLLVLLFTFLSLVFLYADDMLPEFFLYLRTPVHFLIKKELRAEYLGCFRWQSLILCIVRQQQQLLLQGKSKAMILRSQTNRMHCRIVSPHTLARVTTQTHKTSQALLGPLGSSDSNLLLHSVFCHRIFLVGSTFIHTCCCCKNHQMLCIIIFMIHGTDILVTCVYAVPSCSLTLR